MLSKLMAILLAFFGLSSTITTTPSGVSGPLSGPTPTPQAVVYISDVPFTSQAPRGEWSDPRQQDGCEEASVLMAISWARNQALNPQKALAEILKISQFQTDKYGQFHDTSAADTADRLVRDFFAYQGASVRDVSSTSQMIDELVRGNLVVAPMDGRKLGNPYFTAPGPERHMLVIRGYDRIKKQFITNDPGTRRGENYRYSEDVLFAALRDYPTGDHLPITSEPKRIIIFPPKQL